MLCLLSVFWTTTCDLDMIMCHLCESQNIKSTLYLKTSDSAAPKGTAPHYSVQRLFLRRCILT